MRPLPSNLQVTAPSLDRVRDDQGFQWSGDLRALTPIYKGSAQPDGIDEAYPFRAPGLRGQLRMWWRATQDTADVHVLRDQERLLFGDVFDGKPRASRVALGLTGMSSTSARKHELRKLTHGGYDYALWVDRGSDNPLYHVNARATLHVSAHKLPSDRRITKSHIEGLRRAVRALVLFGGAGSRSRRGMGVLWSDALFGTGFDGPDALARELAALEPTAARRDWPSLAGVQVAWKQGLFQSAGQAVDAALDDFKGLRGMRSLGGRNFSGDKRLVPAQEDWRRVRDGRNLPDAFTAALGMPLAYRSSNGHLRGPVMLTPEGKSDRLPSLVHVRAVPSRNRYAAVLLLLQPWYRGRIEARSRGSRPLTGTLNKDVVGILVGGLRAKKWTVAGTGRHA